MIAMLNRDLVLGMHIVAKDHDVSDANVALAVTNTIHVMLNK
jgi:hypothetical protein